MINREELVEQFTFTCQSCAHVWALDYDVFHVEDGHGHDCDYFFRHRHQIADPRARHAVSCPICASSVVRVKLTAMTKAMPSSGQPPRLPGGAQPIRSASDTTMPSGPRT